MLGIVSHASPLSAALLAQPALWRGSGLARVAAPSLTTGDQMRHAGLDALLVLKKFPDCPQLVY